MFVGSLLIRSYEYRQIDPRAAELAAAEKIMRRRQIYG